MRSSSETSGPEGSRGGGSVLSRVPMTHGMYDAWQCPEDGTAGGKTVAMRVLLHIAMKASMESFESEEAPGLNKINVYG